MRLAEKLDWKGLNQMSKDYNQNKKLWLLKENT
jgi:hypothetical protein